MTVSSIIEGPAVLSLKEVTCFVLYEPIELDFMTIKLGEVKVPTVTSCDVDYVDLLAAEGPQSHPGR